VVRKDRGSGRERGGEEGGGVGVWVKGGTYLCKAVIA